MSAFDQSQYLVWRSGSVANEGKAEVSSRAESDAIDPQRHFASVN
jgi:hypothetical protein